MCLQSPTTLADFYHDGVERREKTVVLSAKSVRVTEAGVVSDPTTRGKRKGNVYSLFGSIWAMWGKTSLRRVLVDGDGGG